MADFDHPSQEAQDRVTVADLIDRGVLVATRPFAENSHGLGCSYRRGHDCDCTARTKVVYVTHFGGTR